MKASKQIGITISPNVVARPADRGSAARNRLPTISDVNQFAEEGGLMVYGPDRVALFRRAATYVDKILKGTKPAQLPVEQPTKFELVINLKLRSRSE